MKLLRPMCPNCREELLVSTSNSGPYGATEYSLVCPEHGEIYAGDFQYRAVHGHEPYLLRQARELRERPATAGTLVCAECTACGHLQHRDDGGGCNRCDKETQPITLFQEADVRPLWEAAEYGTQDQAFGAADAFPAPDEWKRS